MLSQSTTDANQHRAFAALKAAFPDWDAVRRAPVEQVGAVIRPAGLAVQKAPRIQRILDRAAEEPRGPDLEWLGRVPLDEAMGWLTALDGVGPKTAACVLSFSFNRHVLPVDTHVHRVSRRLGLIPAKASAERADRILHDLVPDGLRTPLHVGLIRLGREICKAPTPRCAQCPLKDLCPTAPRYL